MTDRSVARDAYRRAFVLFTQICSTDVASAEQKKITEQTDGSAQLLSSQTRTPVHPVVVVGGMVLDVQAQPSTSADVRAGGSVPGTVCQTSGGVARNICECLGRLVNPGPLFVSVIGNDEAGRTLLTKWQALGLSPRGIVGRQGVATATVSTIFNRAGEVVGQIADTSALEQQLDAKLILRFKDDICRAPFLILDANLSAQTLEVVCALAAAHRVPVWFEPVSVPKSVRIAKLLQHVTYISPNADELVALGNTLRLQQDLPVLPEPDIAAAGTWQSAVDRLRPFLELVLDAGVPYVVLTLGEKGAALACKHPTTRQKLLFHMKALPAKVVNSSGAGDCLVAAAVAALVRNADPLEAVAQGMAAAQCAVECEWNVPPSLHLSTVQRGAQEVLDTLELLQLSKH